MLVDNPAVTDIDLDDLERKARAAQDDSPGPWRYDERRDVIVSVNADRPMDAWSETVLIGGAVGYESAALCGSREVLDYVSAAHPSAVLALVARVRAAEADRDELHNLREMAAVRGGTLYWCPHCREVLRGVGVWIMEGRPAPVCSRHINEGDLQPITDEVARAAYAKGSLLMRITESEREELHVLRSQLGESQARIAQLEAELAERD